MPAAASAADNRRLWIEVAVVFAVGVVPDLVSALQHIAAPDAMGTQTFRAQALGLIARSVGVAAPVLYIMWRSDGFRAFGLSRFRPLLDLPAGIGVWGLGYVAYLMAWSLIMAAPGAEESYDSSIAELRLEEMFRPPSGPAEGLLLVVMSIANAFAEQLVICGFLVTRLAVLLGSAARAVAVGALLMASYHLYQGPVAAALIFAWALVSIGLFAATRRLWPFVVAHAIADVLAYLEL